MRCLTEGIHRERWQPLVRETKNLLIDGGWLQMVELHFNVIQLSSGRLEDAPNLQRWKDCYRHSMELLNRDPGVARNLGQLMEQAGLTNIQRPPPYSLPIGVWNPSMLISHHRQTHIMHLGASDVNGNRPIAKIRS